LAESTPGDTDTVFLLLISKGNSIDILLAFILIMAPCRNRSRRTACCTDLARLVVVEEAIGPVVGINLLRRLEGQVRHHASDAHRLTLCRDQPVAQTEGAQTGGIGRVPFGPVGGQPTLGDFNRFQ